MTPPLSSPITNTGRAEQKQDFLIHQVSKKFHGRGDERQSEIIFLTSSCDRPFIDTIDSGEIHDSFMRVTTLRKVSIRPSFLASASRMA